MALNSHFLVAGLGNITHPRTRHSIGHLIIDALTLRLGIPLLTERTGYVATTSLQVGKDQVTFTFFKPRAFMNLSGEPVVKMLRKTAVNPANMILVVDDLDRKPCTTSPKFGGSPNGHNGVRSVIAALGNEKNFHRLRLGIGRDDTDPSEYVLGPLSIQELEHWSVTGPGSEAVWKELTRIVQKSLKT
ncbi:peptidyl-tRNA hydrolase [Earliella scabrosa]|nr:peptidyl-tRNA hydrolase [Earliella scabrosa]